MTLAVQSQSLEVLQAAREANRTSDPMAYGRLMLAVQDELGLTYKGGAAVPYTERDKLIAQIIREDAPIRPFTMPDERGRMGVEEQVGVFVNNNGLDNLNNQSLFVLKGTQYSSEYAKKLTETHKVLKDNGYETSEHALNKILGRINQGKIMSLDQVIDVLKTGTTYKDTIEGGIIKFKDGVAIAIANDGVIKTVIGKARIKPTWEELK